MHIHLLEYSKSKALLLSPTPWRAAGLDATSRGDKACDVTAVLECFADTTAAAGTAAAAITGQVASSPRLAE